MCNAFERISALTYGKRRSERKFQESNVRDALVLDARPFDGVRGLEDSSDTKRPEHEKREYDCQQEKKDNPCGGRGATRNAGKSERARDDGDHNEHNQEFDHCLCLLVVADDRPRCQHRSLA